MKKLLAYKLHNKYPFVYQIDENKYFCSGDVFYICKDDKIIRLYKELLEKDLLIKKLDPEKNRQDYILLRNDILDSFELLKNHITKEAEVSKKLSRENVESLIEGRERLIDAKIEEYISLFNEVEEWEIDRINEHKYGKHY